LSEFLSSSTKHYEARVRFGQSTETYDAEGELTLTTGEAPPLEAVKSALGLFRGTIEQVPPPFSAVKVKGRKAYELAREGKRVDLKPRQVTISRLELTEYEAPELTISVECSAGTYIRSLANDLGASLGTGAYLAALRRLRSGPFSLEDAVPLRKLEHAIAEGDWRRHMRPAVEALPELPIVSLHHAELERIRNGLRIPGGSQDAAMARGIGPTGELVAILESIEGQWHPRKVFLP
jgi:tRNA pseudouridine55 synthase